MTQPDSRSSGVPSATAYRAADWWAALATFAVALAVYVYTLCPTVGFGDEGCLITASYRLGVPFPTCLTNLERACAADPQWDAGTLKHDLRFDALMRHPDAEVQRRVRDLMARQRDAPSP